MRPRLPLLFLFLLLVIFATYGCSGGTGSQKLTFQTEYQAVFLGNGQVFFGKAEIGPDYVTLKDVFYIQSQINQETKEVSNTLIKRGKEWHGPDVMYINSTHVLFIEPISPESQVAKLIKEQMAQIPAEKK